MQIGKGINVAGLSLTRPRPLSGQYGGRIDIIECPRCAARNGKGECHRVVCRLVKTALVIHTLLLVTQLTLLLNHCRLPSPLITLEDVGDESAGGMLAGFIGLP